MFDIGWKRDSGAGGGVGIIKGKLKDLVVFSRSFTGQEVNLLKGIWKYDKFNVDHGISRFYWILFFLILLSFYVRLKHS